MTHPKVSVLLLIMMYALFSYFYVILFYRHLVRLISRAVSLCPPMLLSNNLLSCFDTACDPILFYLILSHLILSYLVLSFLTYHTSSLSIPLLSFFRDDPQLYRAPLTPDVLSTHERIEELLESHLLDVESLEAKLSYLLKTLQNAEASVCTRTLLIV